MKRGIRFVRIFCVLSLVLFLLAGVRIPVGATVVTTKEPANGNTIYIAGNPELYPVEYYDEKVGRYLGVLPSVYEKLAKETGWSFSYISAETDNVQSRLARNSQVEIISAHLKGEVKDVYDEVLLFTFEKNGKEQEVYLGFTELASQELRQKVTAFVRNLNVSDVLRFSMTTAEDQNKGLPPILAYIFLGILAAGLIPLFIYLIRRRKIEKQKKELAAVDPVTGIGNARYFDYWYSRQITPSVQSLYYFAYISIDMEKVEEVTDKTIAKDIIIFAAEEISNSAADLDFCAHISEGSFALAYQAPTREQAEDRIREILDKLNDYQHELLKTRQLDFYAGVYHTDAPNTPMDKALVIARSACHMAQHERVPFLFNDSAAMRNEDKRKNLQNELKKAIEEQEFKLYIQYIFDPKEECAVGAEVIPHWHSTQRGIVYPGEYQMLLEEADLVTEFDFNLLENCCRLLVEWREPPKLNLFVNCNLTWKTISEPTFPERFREIVERYQPDLSRLVVGITDKSLATGDGPAAANIAAIKEMGCMIAMDDFGGGYFSVRDLSDFPIDLIKIDPLILEKASSEQREVLLNGIIRLAHYMGMQVISEGLETEEQLEVLRKAGSDYVQGYYYSHVYPADEPSVDRLIRFAKPET